MLSSTMVRTKPTPKKRTVLNKDFGDNLVHVRAHTQSLSLPPDIGSGLYKKTWM